MILISPAVRHSAFQAPAGLPSYCLARLRLILLLSLMLAGSTCLAELSNLATNGVATGSSEGYGSVFADANDGNRDGQFYTGGSVWHTTIPDASLFYEVDLGGTVFLDRMMIWPRTD